MSQDQPFIGKVACESRSWVRQNLWDRQGFSQVDGVSDMAPACQLFVLWGDGLE